MRYHWIGHTVIRGRTLGAVSLDWIEKRLSRRGAQSGVHGPSEYSPPPRRGCPFHQGTTAEAAARPVVRSPRRSHSHIKLRPHSDRRPRTPPQATADQMTQRRLRDSARALARQRAPMRQLISIIIIIITIIQNQNPHQHRHQNQHPHQQQTRWRGASYPASFDSTGHPNRHCGREPLTQFHSTLLGTHRRRGTTTSVVTEGKRHAVKGLVAEGGGPQLAHCTGIFC